MRMAFASAFDCRILSARAPKLGNQMGWANRGVLQEMYGYEIACALEILPSAMRLFEPPQSDLSCDKWEGKVLGGQEYGLGLGLSTPTKEGTESVNLPIKIG